MSRGQINNQPRKKQIIDYSGIRYRNITPTDIDGFFEIQNKAFIFIELKWRDTHCPNGQRLAIARLVDAISRPAIAIIASHNIDNPAESIIAEDCIVREFRYNCEWYHPKNSQCTLREGIDLFLGKEKLSEYVSNNDAANANDDEKSGHAENQRLLKEWEVVDETNSANAEIPK